jgi:hypothetical protein
MSKPGRLWFPLDVTFWNDPDIIAVGEGAAVLLQKIIGYSKQQGLDGMAPMAIVRTLGGRRWRDKFEPLVSQGLAELSANEAPTCAQFVASLSDVCAAKWCRVVAYLAWNDSSDAVDKRREIAAEKKRQQRAAKANVPQGRPDAVPGHRVEVETEKSNSPSEKDLPSSPPSAPSPPVDLTGEIRALEARYPAELCAEVRGGVGLSRRNGRIADSVWLATLRKLEPHPVAIATHAMQVFVEKYADGDKGEAYLVAIARREAAGTNHRTRGPARASTQAEFAAAWDPKYDDPDQIDWGGKPEAKNA